MVKKRKIVISAWVPIFISALIWIITFLLGNWGLASLLSGLFLLVYMIVLSIYDMTREDYVKPIFVPWVVLGCALTMILLAIFGFTNGLVRINATNIRFDNISSIFVGSAQTLEVSDVKKLDVENAGTAKIEKVGEFSFDPSDLVLETTIPVEDKPDTEDTTEELLAEDTEETTAKITSSKEESLPEETTKANSSKEKVIEETSKSTTASTSKKTASTTSAPVVITPPSNDDTTSTPTPVSKHTHKYFSKYDSKYHFDECDCGKIKNKQLHDLKVKKEVKSTCKVAGYIIYECKCGYSYKKELPLVDHKWNSGKETKKPTCKDKGTIMYTCTICGKNKTSEIAATGKCSFGEWQVVTEPTCENEGTQIRRCKECGAEETKKVPALGHEVGSTWKYDEYKHFKECDRCHKVVQEGMHIFSGWTTTKEATEYSTGQKIRKCECGYEEKEEIPMLEKKVSGKIEIEFGQDSYSMGGIIFVTIRYTGITKLEKLKLVFAGEELEFDKDYFLVYSGDDFTIFKIKSEIGSTGVKNLLVDAEGCERAIGYITIEQ